jgi:FlaG/FlaF family flagellin (archaellin)
LAYQTFTLVDTTPPSLTAAADISIECGTDLPAADATAYDSCGEATWTVAETFAPGCAETGVYTRIYTATDDCGNTATDTQTITLVDTTPPSITAAADASIECGTDIPAADATADDSCGEATWTVAETFAPGCGETGVYTRIYTATDDCGNTATDTQTITVVDTTPPSISCPPLVLVECSIGSMDSEFTGMPDVNDVCGDVSLDYVDFQFTGTCNQTYERVWTATDECGNSANCSQIINVVDTTSPTITAAADVTIECGDNLPASDAEVADICTEVSWSVVETFSQACGEAGVYTRVYTATDQCGNTAIDTQTITVVDNTAPSLTAAADASIECGTDLPAAAATAEDACGEATWTVAETFAPGCGETGVYTRIYTATDDCGNTATDTQTIAVVDTTPPSITAAADANIECGADLPAANATADDSCGEATWTVAETFAPGCGATGVYTRIYTATDDCGNTATATQVITIVDESVPTLVYGPSDLSLECTDEIPTDEAEFSDICDEDLSVLMQESENLLPCGFEIVRTWTATDDCGNTSIYVQTITIVDSTAPEFDNAPVNATVECNEVPVAPAVTASDSCDEQPVVSYLGETQAGTCPIILTRSWVAVDACGNSSVHEQTITVEDTTAPTINGVPANLEVECNQVPAPAQPTASDLCDSEVSLVFNEVSDYSECPFTVTRTWTATDDCGNTQVATQVITVVDNEAPYFGDYPINVEVACDSLEFHTVDVYDDCSEVTLTFVDAPFSGACYGVIQRQWIATDACGNTTQSVQFMLIVDYVAPTASIDPQDISIQCGEEVPSAPVVTATDNCDEDVTITFSEEQSGTDCPYVITRTWTLTDDCGNVNTVDQLITVVTNIIVQDIALTAAPNPFTGDFKITFTLPEDGFVILEVYDALGSKTEIVYNGFALGDILYEMNIDASSWENGVYYSRLIVDGQTKTERIVKSK